MSKTPTRVFRWLRLLAVGSGIISVLVEVAGAIWEAVATVRFEACTRLRAA